LLAVGHVGRDFGREFLYLGGNRVLYTHLGCFDAPGRAGAGAKRFLTCPRSPAFPIRQVVPVGLARARFCSWARWAWFFVVEKLYIASYTVFTHNTMFFIHRGKREWVDASGWVWMMLLLSYLRSLVGSLSCCPSAFWGNGFLGDRICADKKYIYYSQGGTSPP